MKDRARTCRLEATPIKKATSGSPGWSGHIDRFAIGVAASPERIPRARQRNPASCGRVHDVR